VDDVMLRIIKASVGQPVPLVAPGNHVEAGGAYAAGNQNFIMCDAGIQDKGLPLVVPRSLN
jgi:hypothetical protein